MKAFPKTIYLIWEGEGDEAYLSIRTDVENATDIDESRRCAVYDLSGQGIVSVTRRFDFQLRRAKGRK